MDSILLSIDILNVWKFRWLRTGCKKSNDSKLHQEFLKLK